MLTGTAEERILSVRAGVDTNIPCVPVSLTSAIDANNRMEGS